MDAAERLALTAESWREQAVKKAKRYSKNPRFKKAAEYWTGYAQAAANFRHIANGLSRIEKGETQKKKGTP